MSWEKCDPILKGKGYHFLSFSYYHSYKVSHFNPVQIREWIYDIFTRKKKINKVVIVWMKMYFWCQRLAEKGQTGEMIERQQQLR